MSIAVICEDENDEIYCLIKRLCEQHIVITYETDIVYASPPKPIYYRELSRQIEREKEKRKLQTELSKIKCVIISPPRQRRGKIPQTFKKIVSNLEDYGLAPSSVVLVTNRDNLIKDFESAGGRFSIKENDEELKTKLIAYIEFILFGAGKIHEIISDVEAYKLALIICASIGYALLIAGFFIFYYHAHYKLWRWLSYLPSIIWLIGSLKGGFRKLKEWIKSKDIIVKKLSKKYKVL